jgi:hypothetical protein
MVPTIKLRVWKKRTLLSNEDKVFVAYGREIKVLEADSVTISNRTQLPGDDDDDDECRHDHTIAAMLLTSERLVVITSSNFCGQDWSFSRARKYEGFGAI